MKIGILTFHRAHNYGAMLQAYALYLVLTNKGHEVEFISYRNQQIESAYSCFRWRYSSDFSFWSNIKNFIAELIMFTRWQRRRKKFISFAHRFLPESKHMSLKDMRTFSFEYDAVFFGSDQIWTTRFLKRFDPIYWGEINLQHGKKIAYAPSMELTSLSESQKEFVRSHLPLFDALSVREVSMSDMLNNLTAKPIKTVLDPTLLCSPWAYNNVIKCARFRPDKPYILLYQVGDFEVVAEIATYLSQILSYDLVEIRSSVTLRPQKYYKEDLDPSEFISLIDNAELVLSCSFHGTAFAVNFHKPFYSILIKGMDSRVRSLLSQIGMMDRGISSVKDIKINEILDVDYSYAQSRLDVLRAQSIDYIDNALAHSKSNT